MHTFFIPPQAGLQKILTPLIYRPPPYCWIKNDQPLNCFLWNGGILMYIETFTNIFKQSPYEDNLHTQCSNYARRSVNQEHLSSYSLMSNRRGGREGGHKIHDKLLSKFRGRDNLPVT